MNLASATKALLEELIRMRSEGIERVNIDEDTIRNLQASLVPTNGIDTPLTDQSVDMVEEPIIGKRKTEDLIEPQVVTLNRDNSVMVKDPVPKLPFPPKIELPDGEKKVQWDWLRRRVLECETCNAELNPNGRVVFGEGDLNADLFLCGEAPNTEEESVGFPFRGPPGDLLVKILSAMGLNREKVYMANILNWRPRHNQAYGNRPPTQEEIGFCLPYLKSQIEIVKPKVVVALGKVATDGLLGHDPKRRLSHVRGKWHDSLDLPMMVTYHPSYLLHNPSKASKRKVWEDFMSVMDRLKMPVSDKQKSFFL